MATVTMLNHTVKDKRAWQAATIDEPANWYYPLTEPCLAELGAWIKMIETDTAPMTTHFVQSETMPACVACLEPVREALSQERGFAIIERIPEHYSVEQAQACYWAIGQFLGQPVEQNIEGTLLYSVRDTGQNVAEGARFSVTNAESSFHTDGAFWDESPHVIGLLCLATARSGGQSQLISGYTIHNELLEHAPEALQVLYETFYIDRRGGFFEGELPVVEHPVFELAGAELTLRYLNYYIHAAHEKMSQPLTTAQDQALATVEALLKRADLRIEFSLQPGQMLFTNNHWILHNRTAFEDYADIERRRHYVRLWLQ